MSREWSGVLHFVQDDLLFPVNQMQQPGWDLADALIPSQAESLLIFERRHSHVFLEQLGETALVAKAEITGDFADLRPFELQ